MEEELATALTFLSYTCIILFTVITVFLVMFLKDLTELVKSYTKLSDTIQKEISPTLIEIKRALDGINNFATDVDKQITAVKSSFGTAYDLAFNAASKLRGATTSLLGGILTGLKVILKK